MTPRDAFAVLFRADIRYALHSTRGVLLLVFHGLFWVWAFTRLAGGGANVLTGPEAGMVASWLLGDDELLRLFRENSPTMSAYFVIALSTTPIFATLAGCDQTASDLASKHLRFLIPRTGRGSIYLARFCGAAALLVAVQLLATIVAVFVAVMADSTSTGAVVGFALRVGLALVVYSVAWVALLAPLTAAIPSPATVALTALGVYAVLAIIVATVQSRWPWASGLLYLTPGGAKAHLLDPDLGPSFAAAAGLALQSAVYLALGWKIFRERDA
jgi:ABC-type transport system involved in multi-copper enzyme maturation permease subunit